MKTLGSTQINLPADRLVAGRHAARAVRYSRRGILNRERKVATNNTEVIQCSV